MHTNTDSCFLPALAAKATKASFPRVIRRDIPGDTSGKPRIVDWIGHKITQAVDAACQSVGQPPVGAEVRAHIEAELGGGHTSLMHIEQLQDMVEEALITLGHTRAALAYGKYRVAHLARRQQAAEKFPLPEVNDPDLSARLSFAKIDLNLTMSDQEILVRLSQSLSPNLTETERRDTIVLNAKTLLDTDADSRYLAGRILLTYIYEEVLPWKITDGIGALKAAHFQAFLSYIPHGIEIGRLSKEMGEFKLARVASQLDPMADLQFDFIGVQNLYDRYLVSEPLAGGGKRRMETPQMFWLRVAMGLSLRETDKEEKAVDFYNIYRSKSACSSTPTLFNSGTAHPQLSSCYLLTVDDSIDAITENWTRFSQLSKWAGGLGCSWTSVRGSGSRIHGTNGESGGIVPFLKVSNDIALAVNQGGKRPGALCSYLEVWHLDVEDFLDLRKETGDDRRRTHNMNTCLWVCDLFMKRMELISEGKLPKDTMWTLFSSNQTPDLPELYGAAFEARYAEYEQMAAAGKIASKQIRVLALWKKMLESLFETGHPWITFKDPSNVRSPQDHCGVVHSSNLCTEITLNTSMEEVAVCNLASVNIPQHILADGSIDIAKLARTVRTLMRMLDNVIDINFYPVEAARTANMRHRPVGLGVMGLQDALYMKRIPFDTVEAVAFNDEIMELIAYLAYDASSDLAAERGAYSSFKGSKWDRGLLPLDTVSLLEQERGMEIQQDRSSRLNWDVLKAKISRQGMRNSNCMAIAPTATISNIMGSTPCIEPSYKHIHTKSNLSGEFVRTNDFLVKDLMALGLWDEEMRSDLKYFDGSVQPIERVPDHLKTLYKAAFEIEPTWILQAASARQKWIDQSQSTNLFVAVNDARMASFMYREAWKRGLKTTYYLRTLNKSAIDSSNRERKVATPAPLTASAVATVAAPEPEPEMTAAKACSIEAMRNGTICEACQ